MWFIKTFFEDESIVFRDGMAGIYSIENKKMVVDVVIPVEKGDFPLSTLDHVLAEGVVDPAIFGRPFSFVEDQFDLYQFRNTLAFHFLRLYLVTKKKGHLDSICIANLFIFWNSRCRKIIRTWKYRSQNFVVTVVDPF